MSKDKKADNVRSAINTIEKVYGKGAVMRLGDRAQMKVSVVPTGCLSLDIELGIGGLPRGRIVEVYGQEASGKTTLALHALAQAQAAGGTCAFVDAEHALDPKYAAALGVQVDDLLISQPDTGEQALEIVDILTRSGGIDLIVVDSVAALTPKAELEGDMGDSHVGLQARLMSQALRKLTGAISRTGCTVLFINQVRQKIGVMFGNGQVTTGGNALKFYSSLRLEIRRIGSIKQGDKILGNRTRIKVVKNKMAPPFRDTEVDIYYGEGISASAELLDMGLESGVIKRNGTWFSAEKERLGQGREQARAALLEHTALCDRIRMDALIKAGIIDPAPAGEDAGKPLPPVPSKPTPTKGPGKPAQAALQVSP